MSPLLRDGLKPSLEFTLIIEPKPKKSPIVTKRGFAITNPQTRIYQSTLRRLSLQFKPKKPFEGALSIDTHFIVKAPQRVKSPKEYPIVRPDHDNLTKALLDPLNGLFWTDDSIIVEHTIRKIYDLVDKRPRIYVAIYELVC